MDITKNLAAVARELNIKFTLRGKPMDALEVFARDSLLPAFMRRANQLCSFCLDHELGATFEKSEGTPLGVIVVLDKQTPTSLRLLCVVDVLIEIMQQDPDHDTVSLDSLLED